MTTILYNLGNIKEIFTKLSLVFFQPTKTDVKQDWIYRGEGNANLVISLPSRRQILRIRKTRRSRTLIDWIVELFADFLSDEDGITEAEECRDVKFYRNVMMPLLGCFVCDATPIVITRRQTEDLNSALMQCRPNYRKHKKLKFGKATFLTDFAFLPKHLDSYRLTGSTYAVEIKPKQGWVPNRNAREKCKFCQNQYLKLAQGQIKRISTYCPLDLFSGSKSRMMKAIKSLVTHPQNNFKIFKNGVQMYGDQSSIDIFYDLLKDWLHNGKNLSNISLMEEFSELIYKTLIKSIDKTPRRSSKLPSTSQDENSTAFHPNLCDPAQVDFPEGCILERILSVQKLNRNGVLYYKQLKDRMRPTKSVDYVKTVLNELEKNARSEIFSADYNEGCDRKVTELDLAPYLVASVANDCSFMLTYRKMTDNRNSTAVDQRFVSDSPNGSYAVNVGVFDLYPKPMSTIDKHYKRLQEMAKLTQ